jgi:hypothetical protein
MDRREFLKNQRCRVEYVSVCGHLDRGRGRRREKRVTLEIWLPHEESTAHITYQCFNKRANRLPETMWLSFSPDALEAGGWLLPKVDQRGQCLQHVWGTAFPQWYEQDMRFRFVIRV